MALNTGEQYTYAKTEIPVQPVDPGLLDREELQEEQQETRANHGRRIREDERIRASQVHPNLKLADQKLLQIRMDLIEINKSICTYIANYDQPSFPKLDQAIDFGNLTQIQRNLIRLFTLVEYNPKHYE